MRLAVSFLVFSCSVLAMATSSAASDDVEGVWQSACLPNKGSYSQMKASFSPKRFTIEAKGFEDRACAVPHLAMTMIGDYTLGAKKASPEGYDIQEIDFKLESFLLVPLSETVAEFLNAGTLGGFRDWKVGTPRDWVGGEWSGVKGPAKGEMSYGAVRREKNRLWLSPIKPSLEKKNRPDTVDENYPLDLQ